MNENNNLILGEVDTSFNNGKWITICPICNKELEVSKAIEHEHFDSYLWGVYSPNTGRHVSYTEFLNGSGQMCTSVRFRR